MRKNRFPTHWTVRPISEVAAIVTETIEPSHWPDKEFNYISLEHVESGTGRLNGFEPTKGREIRSSKVRFTGRHVLYGKLRPYLNKVLVPDFDGIATSEILILEPSPALLERKFLAHYLRSPEFVTFASNNVTGSRMPRVSMREFKKVEIPIPPLEEQRRIVARIEELLSRIDQAKSLRQESLRSTSAILSSALNDAFRRLNNLMAIGDVAKLINGRAFKPADWSNRGLPIIRIQNLNDETKPFNFFDRAVAQKFTVDNGDILISWSGTPGTSFGAHIWNRGAGILNQHIFRVELQRDRVEKDFFVYAVNHKLDELIAKAHGGVGLQHITKGKLERTRIPVPKDRSEQRQISIRLDDLKEGVTQLHRLQSETDKEIEQLTQSILTTAFRGEL